MYKRQAIVPIASQQFARIEINNILFKRERGMLLLSASHQLMLASQGENIIPDDVLLPVMLMKSGALGSIDNILFQQDMRAAFVRVQAPPSVGKRIHIVNQIIANDRALLDSQGIDRPHVAEDPLPDVMQMIVFDDVVVARAGLVAPGPAE